MSLDLKRIFEIIQQHFGTDVVRIFQMVSTGIKNEEIAQELGIPLSTVKTKIRRTRIFLKNLNA
jgi:DNA-binding NarL/FixJ family response regulator